MNKSKNIETIYDLSTDKQRLEVEVIHSFLKESYWAKNISKDMVRKTIENSFCVGVYYQNQQVGFARAVTDYATFGYIADVFIIEKHRGRNLSKKLISFILNHPDLQGFRGWVLGTRDAHTLYEKFGFQPIDNEVFMNLRLKVEY